VAEGAKSFFAETHRKMLVFGSQQCSALPHDDFSALQVQGCISSDGDWKVNRLVDQA